MVTSSKISRPSAVASTSGTKQQQRTYAIDPALLDPALAGLGGGGGGGEEDEDDDDWGEGEDAEEEEEEESESESDSDSDDETDAEDEYRVETGGVKRKKGGKEGAIARREDQLEGKGASKGKGKGKDKEQGVVAGFEDQEELGLVVFLSFLDFCVA